MSTANLRHVLAFLSSRNPALVSGLEGDERRASLHDDFLAALKEVRPQALADSAALEAEQLSRAQVHAQLNGLWAGLLLERWVVKRAPVDLTAQSRPAPGLSPVVLSAPWLDSKEPDANYKCAVVEFLWGVGDVSDKCGLGRLLEALGPAEAVLAKGSYYESSGQTHSCRPHTSFLQCSGRGEWENRPTSPPRTRVPRRPSGSALRSGVAKKGTKEWRTTSSDEWGEGGGVTASGRQESMGYVGAY